MCKQFKFASFLLQTTNSVPSTDPRSLRGARLDPLPSSFLKRAIMIYSTYLATCRQLDDPRYFSLYYQSVSATHRMIIVSEASSVTSTAKLLVFRLISADYKKLNNLPRF